MVYVVNLHDGPIFGLDNEKGNFRKELTEISEIAKFGGAMLKSTRNIPLQICRLST